MLDALLIVVYGMAIVFGVLIAVVLAMMALGKLFPVKEEDKEKKE